MEKLTLPKLGESITSATVVQWLKKVGDKVELDEPLLEVSTDKVNSEIPSPFAGELKEILAKEDDEVDVGAPLALIATTQGDQEEQPVATAKKQPTPCPLKNKEKQHTFSPAVLRLAQTEGISFETLCKLEGSGEGGRITKKDVEHFIQNQPEQSPPEKTAPTKPAQAPFVPVSRDDEERVKLTGMRKAIADNMVRSFYEAPHASLVYEVDVTNVMKLIANEKERFFAAHGVKLTITSFLIQALSKALVNYPMLNASLEGEMIVVKRYINVGVAVHIDGGLVVPVIKNCHERNLVSLAKGVADISKKARQNKLSPDDVREGTVTLTNFGMTGALLGTPIIRYPEVAIIGAGTIQRRVHVAEDNTFSIRQMMYLTLTFDHRIIDGIYGCNFLSALKTHLESI